MAFYKDPHNRLLTELSDIGIQGSLLMWTKDFLVGGQQNARVNSELTTSETVLSVCLRLQFGGQYCSFCMWITFQASMIFSFLYIDNVKIWWEIKSKCDMLKLWNARRNYLSGLEFVSCWKNPSTCIVRYRQIHDELDWATGCPET